MFHRSLPLVSFFILMSLTFSGCGGENGVKIDDLSTKDTQPLSRNSVAINTPASKKKEARVDKDITQQVTKIDEEIDLADQNISYSLVFEKSFTSLGNIKAVSNIDTNNILYLGYDKGLAKVEFSKTKEFSLLKELEGLYYIEDLVNISEGDCVVVSNGYHGLKTSDANITRIEDINTTLSGGWAGDIEYFKDQNFYVAYGSAGIELLHFDSNRNIIETANFQPSGYIQSIEVSADEMIAFVSAGYGGIDILDLIDKNISVISSIDTNDWVYDLSYDEDDAVLYVAAGKDGIQLYDLNIANQPKLLQKYDLNSTINHVKILQDKDMLIASDDNNTLYTFTTKDKDGLKLKSKLSLEGAINQISYEASLRELFIATSKGLFVYTLNKE